MFYWKCALIYRTPIEINLKGLRKMSKEESIEEQEERGERELIEREELEGKLESIGSKAELEFLSDLISKDRKIVENIYIRYDKLLGKVGLGGNILGGIFRRNYETFDGIIGSLSTILWQIINAKD